MIQLIELETASTLHNKDAVQDHFLKTEKIAYRFTRDSFFYYLKNSLREKKRIGSFQSKNLYDKGQS